MCRLFHLCFDRKALSRRLSLVSCLVAFPVSGATLLLQDGVNGYAGTEDTTLNSGLPVFNYGGRPYVELTNGGSGVPTRILMRFDVSTLTGVYSTIDSITLRLYPTTVPGSAVNVQLYQPVEANGDWVEGTSSGFPVEPGTSSWNKKFQQTSTTGTDWTGGAGLGTTGYGALLAQTEISNTTTAWQPFDLTISDSFLATSLVNDWLTANNEGFLLRLSEEGNAGYYQTSFFDAETSSLNTGGPPDPEALRPTLIVNYTAAPEPGRFVLLMLGAMSLITLRRRGKAAFVCAHGVTDE
jgi:hypothetical protein